MTLAVCIPTLLKDGRPSRYVRPLLKSLSRAWAVVEQSRKTRQGKSIGREQVTHDRVVVLLVVNGLHSDSPKVTQLQTQWQRTVGKALEVQVIASLGNRGFTGAVNDGLIWITGQFEAEWTVILNDDTRVTTSFFQTVLRTVSQKGQQLVTFSVLTPSGQLESLGLKYQSTGLAWPVTSLTSLPSSKRHLLCGTAFMVKASVVTQLKERSGYFFNPLFFAYAEDVELSLRSMQLGITLTFDPTTTVTHYGSQTASRGSELQLYHGYRNLLLTAWLTWSPATWWRFGWLRLLGLLYAIGLTLYKRRWWVWPRIVKYVWVHYRALSQLRQTYVAQLVGHYSF